MGRVTIKDVAASAGVGIATVSRVVHRNSSVAAELRERVENAMRELGYEPNTVARSMRTRSSKMIGIAIRDSSMPEFAAFTRAAEGVMRKSGYTLLLTNTGDDNVQVRDLIKVLASRRIDGLVIAKSTENDAAVDEALTKLGVPVVFIDRYSSPMGDTVAIDHHYGIRAAVNHLVSLGHERIALTTGRPVTRPAQERIRAYEEAMTANGIDIRTDLIIARSFDAEETFGHLSLLLTARERPTAIIAGGMALLAPTLRAIRLGGLEVGRDVSVIAGCDSDLAELMNPGITAIRWDIPAWGRSVSHLLLDRLEDRQSAPPLGRQITIPTELVIRDSCCPVNGADEAS